MSNSNQLRNSREYKKWLDKRALNENDKNYDKFKFEVVSHFIFLGFRDYLASRKLLLDTFHDTYLIGYVLASTTIEKYLKSLIYASDISPGFIHLDKLNRFIELLEETGEVGNKILSLMDHRFLKLLSDTYKFRYFDETVNADGAFVNQVLAELDYVVNLIENSIKIPKTGDAITYQKAAEDKTHPIHIENHVLNKIDKARFMENDSFLYGIRAIGDGMIIEVKSTDTKPVAKYSGEIITFKINAN